MDDVVQKGLYYTQISISDELKKVIHSSDIILDIGYHFGEFPFLLKLKAIGYEAVKQQYKLTNDDVFYKAVIGYERPITFNFVPNDTLLSSCVNTGRGGAIEQKEVDTILFNDVLKAHSECTILKIDVEGEEWNYNFNNIPLNINAIVLEKHYINNQKDTIVLPEFDLVSYKEYPHTHTTDNTYIRKKRYYCSYDCI